MMMMMMMMNCTTLHFKSMSVFSHNGKMVKKTVNINYFYDHIQTFLQSSATAVHLSNNPKPFKSW